ncbi:MAG: hypothetical protein ACRD9W_09060, partial [Terriglobia bacterium]
MQQIEVLNLDQRKEFLDGTVRLRWKAQDREAADECSRKSLEKIRYRKLSKADKGMVRRFRSKVTGLSRAQITRLIQRWSKTGKIQAKGRSKRQTFARKYTAADMAWLAMVDEAHEDLSGPATRRVLRSLHISKPGRRGLWPSVRRSARYSLTQPQPRRQTTQESALPPSALQAHLHWKQMASACHLSGSSC